MMRALSTRDRALKFYCLLIMAASIIERLLANTWYNRLRHRCSRVLRDLVNLAMEFKVRKHTYLVRYTFVKKPNAAKKQSSQSDPILFFYGGGTQPCSHLHKKGVWEIENLVSLSNLALADVKEVQIVYRLFLVNCYLLHIPSLPSQPASNVRG